MTTQVTGERLLSEVLIRAQIDNIRFAKLFVHFVFDIC